MKDVKFLIMSVGPYDSNGTCKYIEKIGGKTDMVIVLPDQFSRYAKTYEKRGVQVFLYNEKQYINDSFEFFGFRPRNCGGVGRQGIAEAVDALDDGNTLFLQLDDDTSNLNVRVRSLENKSSWKCVTIRRVESLKKIVNLLDEFYQSTGIKIQGKTGATISTVTDYFFANRKIFNNFLMYKEDAWKGEGFKSLCSDDVRYNYYKSLFDATPLASIHLFSISFTQNQGDRNDGNAPLYNKDCSWKKSYSLRMITPAFSTQYMSREANRILFRETLQYKMINPPVFLSDKDGKVTAKLIFN